MRSLGALGRWTNLVRLVCSLRGEERTYKFKADDEGMAGRWITALRAVQISCKPHHSQLSLSAPTCSPPASGMSTAIAEWTNRELIGFGRICGFPEEFLSWLQAQNYDGQQFGRLKSPSHLAVRHYAFRASGTI